MIKTSLRYRVAISFLVFGGLISTILGVVLYWLTVNIEERLIEETLSTELEDYIVRFTKNPVASPPASKDIKTYNLNLTREQANNASTALEILRQLDAGLHHILIEGQGYYVKVYKDQSYAFGITYDDSKIIVREQEYISSLVTGIVVITLFSGAVGLWLAARIVAPVRELANQVSQLQPEQSAQWANVEMGNDELDELYRSFHSYQTRLNAFIERERAFTGDISHELRTPLAVIEGASEVLMADDSLDEKAMKRVERIRRSVTVMKRLTSALLGLAREDAGIDTINAPCLISATVKEVVEDYRHLIGHKPVKVNVTVREDFEISTDPALLYVVLSNIVANAYTYTKQGTIVINIQSQSVKVLDTGVGMNVEQQAGLYQRQFNSTDKNGVGIGMSLVKRICDNKGWRINVESEPDRGTGVELIFRS